MNLSMLRFVHFSAAGLTLMLLFATSTFVGRSHDAFAAPAGMLPDVVGLRPDVSPQEAYAFLRHYDRLGHVFVSDIPVPQMSDKPLPIAMTMAQDENAAEKIEADLTLPPGRQTVWRVARYLFFMPGKQPTVENVITSLRRKYGKESYMAPSAAMSLAWYFDTDGHAAILPSSVNAGTCAGHTGPLPPMFWAPAQHGLQYNLIQPLPQGAFEDVCRSLVIVYAQVSLASDQRLVQELHVVVADLPLETREHNRTVVYLANSAAMQRQQELDRATRQAVPNM